ncbi:hypothetical protein DFH09DRAFT_1285102 [Mycena vulgaris]|nr:hypothetical protein DFH09DRAFT_1285102 [Mycena vulgaris]
MGGDRGTQDLRDRLAELNAQANMPDSETERNEIGIKLNKVTFPILTLPVEVTVAIFLRCLHVLHSEPADYHNHKPQPTRWPPDFPASLPRLEGHRARPAEIVGHSAKQ